MKTRSKSDLYKKLAFLQKANYSIERTLHEYFFVDYRLSYIVVIIALCGDAIPNVRNLSANDGCSWISPVCREHISAM